jgi:hypothetical protein
MSTEYTPVSDVDDDASPHISPMLPDPMDALFPSKRPLTPEYVPSKASVDWARDAEAARLAATGHTYPQICVKLGILKRDGTPAVGKAVEMVRRALGAQYRFTSDEMRHSQLQSLDEQESLLWRELEDKQILVQQGRVIHDDDGLAMEDKRLALEIHDRILKVKERRAKLMGLDATTRISVEADQIGSEIIGLISMISEDPPVKPSTPQLPPGENEE